MPTPPESNPDDYTSDEEIKRMTERAIRDPGIRKKLAALRRKASNGKK